MTPVRMGSQRGFIDGDILIYVGQGTMGVHDVHEYHRVAEQILTEHRSLYVLADISGAVRAPLWMGGRDHDEQTPFGIMNEL